MRTTWAWVGVVGVAAGCTGGLSTGCAEAPPLVPKQELLEVRLLVPTEAEVTWSDPDCAERTVGLAGNVAQIARSALSQAGFTTLTDQTAPHDATVRVAVSLESCSFANEFRGQISISLDPGTTAVATYKNYGVPPGRDWDRILVRQLQDAPQVMALAKHTGSGDDAQRDQASKPADRGGDVASDNRDDSESARVARPDGAFVSGTPQRDAYALIVGIDRYRDVPAAPGARADAERMAAIARSTLGIPEEHVKLALDERASKSDLEKHLRWLASNVPAGGRVYFHFSGHGAPDASSGMTYLVPFDGDPASLPETTLEFSKVMQALAGTKAKEVVAFVDACFSGAGGRSVLPPGTRPLVRVQAPKTTAKVALFAAATAAEVSGPAPGGNGGLFTDVLAQGLGKAEADIDGDGTVTLKELSDWVTPRVSRAAKKDNREQTPSLVVGAGMNAGDVYVASGLGAK